MRLDLLEVPGFRRPDGWGKLAVVAALACGLTCPGAPVITEFLADNQAVLADEDGEYADWIEIHNPASTAVSLEGYHLTDDLSTPAQWAFPPRTLEPGGYLVVFASGKNRAGSTGPLHTNFRLAAEGEYLALVGPDGREVLSAFAPAYPPQFEDESFGPGGSGWSYFTAPTPGAPNQDGTPAGPVLEPLVRNPASPARGPVTLEVAVRPVNAPVATVRVHYRRMFGPEAELPMADDGASPDAVAGDGIWTAALPEEAFAPAEMTRWRFAAADGRGVVTREPAFRDPLDSPQYFGTVTEDPGIETRLPVLHWFTSSPGGAGTTAGSRGSVYYEGEFYDNVHFSLHGQSSAQFPKKSYNLDFNRPQRFRWSAAAPRVADIDLLTNWADKSKVRHVLAYEVMREAGVPAHFAFTVRVQQNGRFFSTADLVEDADEIYLERAGLNPDGALYKIYSNLLNKDAGDSAASGVEKKTRKDETNADLAALIDGLDLTGPALSRYLFDHIDLPRCVNLLAANSVIRNIDMHRKNWYLYRDTGRSGEWALLPWDLDLSHGRVWNVENTYFDNALYTDGYVITGTAIRLVAHLFSNPTTRPMILRRIRTLTDRYLQPPPAAGTPEEALYYERRLKELSALLDPADVSPSDARLDFEKWGSWLQGGRTVSFTNASAAVETMAEAIGRFRAEYLPARRAYIYNTQIAGRGGEIPLPQTGGPTFDYTPLVVQGAPVRAHVPAGPALGVRWIGIAANEPFDTSGWLEGVTGVGYERGTGYESLLGLDLDAHGGDTRGVYLRLEFQLSEPADFDRLELRMKYDDGFVAFLNGTVIASANAPTPLRWDSVATASHEADVTTFEVFDITSKQSSLRVGRNVLAIHGFNDVVASSDLIFVPELHGGRVGSGLGAPPVLHFGDLEFDPASGNQDEEYLQLLNRNPIAVDISGWRLEGGVRHAFVPGTVLPPNGTLHVCPNAAAFRARNASPRGGEGHFVQGGYQGYLTKGGSTIALLDDSGAINATVTYAGRPSDAQRHLVISEVMYHPPGDGLAEFIELLNISDAVTLDLRGLRFVQGVTFDFAGSLITSLPPGHRVLIVRHRAAFEAAYGSGHVIAGVFENDTALRNSGEILRLEDAARDAIVEFAYEDSEPWPTEADGAGHSLVLKDPETRPDPNLGRNWMRSTRPGGSPGRPDGPAFPGDPAADTDGNGEPDLIDYALGNDLGLPPIRPAMHAASPGLGLPAVLRLTYPVSLRAAPVTVEVRYSTDLVTWLPAGPHLELVSTQPAGEGRALLTWEVKAPLRDQPRLFMQLWVAMP